MMSRCGRVRWRRRIWGSKSSSKAAQMSASRSSLHLPEQCPRTADVSDASGEAGHGSVEADGELLHPSAPPPRCARNSFPSLTRNRFPMLMVHSRDGKDCQIVMCAHRGVDSSLFFRLASRVRELHVDGAQVRQANPCGRYRPPY
eukprot:1925943-Rhodomonas_salina.1